MGEGGGLVGLYMSTHPDCVECVFIGLQRKTARAFLACGRASSVCNQAFSSGIPHLRPDSGQYLNLLDVMILTCMH